MPKKSQADFRHGAAATLIGYNLGVHKRNPLLVGQIAVEWGLVTHAQIDECLREQSDPKRSRPIGVLLLAKGYLAESQLMRLIDEQRRRLGEPADYVEGRKQDVLFGRLLVRNGWLSADHINEALRLQQELAEEGTDKRLGEILVELGRLRPEAVRATLSAQGKKLMACPACGITYNIVHFIGGRKYKCTKCSNELEVATDTFSADETQYPDEERPPR